MKKEHEARMSVLEENFILDGDTPQQKAVKYLRKARAYLPADDDWLTLRAQQIRDKPKKKFSLTPSEQAGEWLFGHFMEKNELELAWEELHWACDRYEAMLRIGGGRGEWVDRHEVGASRGMFWRCMAMAAKEMIG